MFSGSSKFLVTRGEGHASMCFYVAKRASWNRMHALMGEYHFLYLNSFAIIFVPKHGLPYTDIDVTRYLGYYVSAYLRYAKHGWLNPPELKDLL